MKIFESWKRNMPDSFGESITVTIIYSSFDAGEIDELQKKMPNGMLIMDADMRHRDRRMKINDL